MTPYRIAVLMHEDFIPDEDPPKNQDWAKCEWVTEYDVVTSLKKIGHDVRALGVHDSLKPVREMVEDFKPHITFNLLEEFDNKAFYDQNMVSYLELLRAPYSGCNPRGLMLARDKAIAKRLLTYHRIRTPKFYVFPRNKKVKLTSKVEFPLIVKCLNEEASLGISKASVVTSKEKLLERVEFIHDQIGRDAIAECFIEGQEIYVGVLGNYRLNTLPAWCVFFENSADPEKEFYTNQAKFNTSYRAAKGIRSGKAKISESLENRLAKVAKQGFRALSLSGYARMDFRVDAEENIYLIEANPNPDIAKNDEFAESARFAKINYEDVLSKILSLGISWSSRNAND